MGCLTDQEFCDRQDEFRIKIISGLSSKIKGCPEYLLEDGYSAAVIAGYENINKCSTENKLYGIMFRAAFHAVSEEYTEHYNIKRYLIEGRTHRQSIDFAKMDKRFIRQLTPIQKVIFLGKILHKHSKDIYNHDELYINSYVYLIIKKYKRWLRDSRLDRRSMRRLSNYEKVVLTMYMNGYRNQVIASKLGKTNRNIAVVIYVARRKINR
jgi:hypothetical protein